MALKKSQKSLKKWTKQKWRTKSGKPSTQGSKATGERYLPEKAIKSLSSKEYAATTRKKRKDTKKGKQHSSQPKKVAKKTSKLRKGPNMEGVPHYTKEGKLWMGEMHKHPGRGLMSGAEHTDSSVNLFHKEEIRSPYELYKYKIKDK